MQGNFFLVDLNVCIEMISPPDEIQITHLGEFSWACVLHVCFRSCESVL